MVRQAVLFAVTLVIVPFVFYPRTLGFPPFDLNPAVGLLEWGFYVAVLSIATTRLQLSTRIVAAGFTVVFRLLLGLLTGTLVAAAGNQSWTSTVFDMIWSYPLALVPQVLCAPVVLGRLWEHLLAPRIKPVNKRQLRAATIAVAGANRPATPVHFASSAVTSRSAGISGANGLEPTFDDAVAYVGEYPGVKQCWVVDHEGLPLAVWQRQHYSGDADFWSPISVDVIDYLSSRLSDGGGVCHPQRIEMKTSNGRFIVESARGMWFGVLADAETDDLINVRITRACDMITKTLRMKGGSGVATGEVQYV